MENLNINGKAL